MVIKANTLGASGRYASYWNVFLWLVTQRKIKLLYSLCPVCRYRYILGRLEYPDGIQYAQHRGRIPLRSGPLHLQRQQASWAGGTGHDPRHVWCLAERRAAQARLVLQPDDRQGRGSRQKQADWAGGALEHSLWRVAPGRLDQQPDKPLLNVKRYVYINDFAFRV